MAARIILAAIAITIGVTTRATAQGEHALKGTVAVGVTLGRVEPASQALSTTGTRLRPTIRRLPSRGVGFAFALNWFDAAIGETFAATAEPLGRIAVRPVMVGVAYTVVHDRLAIAPSIVAGPALNTIDIDEALEDSYAIGGNTVERNAGSISAAVRGGVNVTVALAPRVGITTFGGYIWNRPRFTLVTRPGELRSRLQADAAVVEVGLVVSLF